MSEHQPADNTPRSPEPKSSDNNWYSGWEDFSGTPEPQAEADSPEAFPTASDADAWQTVTPPNALSIDALVQDAQQSIPADPSPIETADAPNIDLPDWSVKTFAPQAVEPSEPATPNLADHTDDPPLDVPELVNLIQELNQCNSALLDRVAQLEEALEDAKQKAGQTDNAEPNATEREVHTAQVEQLLQELEAAQQTGHKQQILIENLHSQLAHSHDRIAHLEKSYAALQQQQADYDQQIAQRDQLCRDLQVRLQRQQRYTLQFKAALEQSLEMAAVPQDLGHLPSTEDVTATGAIDPTTIQPSQPQPVAPTLLPKVQHIQPWSSQSTAAGLPTKLDGLLGQSLTPDSSAPAPAAPAETSTLDSTPPPPPHLMASPDSAATTHQPPEGSAATDTPPPDPELQATSDALKAASADLNAAIHDALKITTASSGHSPTSAAELKALQDLARMANVSVEDVLQVNQVASSSAPDTPEPMASSQRPTLSMPLELFQQTGTQPATGNNSAEPGIQPLNVPTPNSPDPQPNRATPAPRVYPFRPLKKIDSIAAVDLPKFPTT